MSLQKRTYIAKTAFLHLKNTFISRFRFSKIQQLSKLSFILCHYLLAQELIIQCRAIGIGFCSLRNSYDQMPGWFKGSWGYHSDDGELFIESGCGIIPSSDFGDSGTFESGDIVGVCLNMNTGQGFCTRNGKRLDMGRLLGKN